MNESVWLIPWFLGLLSTLFLPWRRKKPARSLMYLSCACILWGLMAVFLHYIHQRFPANLSITEFGYIPAYGSSLALHISMSYAFISMTLEGVRFYRAQDWYIGMVVTTLCFGFMEILAYYMGWRSLADMLGLSSSLLMSVIAASLVFRVRPIYRWLYDIITELKRSRRSLRSLVPSIMRR